MIKTKLTTAVQLQAAGFTVDDHAIMYPLLPTVTVAFSPRREIIASLDKVHDPVSSMRGIMQQMIVEQMDPAVSAHVNAHVASGSDEVIVVEFVVDNIRVNGRKEHGLADRTN